MNFQLRSIFVNLIIGVFARQSDGTPNLTERAIQIDREPLVGQLEKHPGEGLVFRSHDNARVPIQYLRRVENMNPPQIPPGTSPAHRLHLWGTESLSGVIQSFDNDHIQVVTGTGDPLSVPLSALQKVIHFQGDAVILHDDFEEEDTSRQVWGQAKRTTDRAASGHWGFSLTSNGDTLQYHLSEPVMAGWFETRFWDSGEVNSSAQWYCEFDFESKAGIRTVQVLLGPAAESYALATPLGPSLPVQRIARQRGWNRLAMRFSADRITLLINDAVLTHAVLTHRPVGIGSFRTVRFLARSGEAAQEKLGQPEWVGAIDDVQIAAGLPAATERQPARDQDDFLLTNGDQLFGRVVNISRDDATIESDFGPQSVRWQKLHAVHFMPRPSSARQVAGQRIRIEFAAASTPSAASDYDTLEGTLRELTDKTISLEHPFLGTVRIRRDQMRAIEFFPGKRWLAIDPGFHHFGEQVNVRLQVPHPGGPERSWQFVVDEVPDRATLVLNVVDMLAMPPGSEAIKRTPGSELHTYAEINGQSLEPLGLNHLLAVRYRNPTRITVAVPGDVLKKGTNTLRIYQNPSKDDPHTYDDCGIFGIALELP